MSSAIGLYLTREVLRGTQQLLFPLRVQAQLRLRACRLQLRLAHFRSLDRFQRLLLRLQLCLHRRENE
jgi:hypothetical protein